MELPEGWETLISYLKYRLLILNFGQKNLHDHLNIHVEQHRYYKPTAQLKPPLVSVANLFCLAWTSVGPREVPLCHMHTCIHTDIC